MKKNNKGFTLVELLVAIAIASILSVIALSGVANIREHNKNKKFEAYEKAMLTGAKLYTDSYADDMFEGDSSSCYTISYNELKSKNLLQDFQENDISCSNNHTYVLVRRINDYYEYQYSLSCTNSQNQIVYSGGSKNKSSSCNGADNSAPNVIIDPNSSKGSYKMSKNIWCKTATANCGDHHGQVLVTVTDDSGLTGSFYYTWKKVGNVVRDDNRLNQDNQFVGFSTGRGEFSIPYPSDFSKRKTEVNFWIPIPDNASGKYQLIISPGNVDGLDPLKDLANNQLTGNVLSDEFWLDNEAPKFNGAQLVSSHSQYNDISADLDLTDISDNHDSFSNIVKKYSVDNSSTKTSINQFKTKLSMGTQLDGTKKTISVTLKDTAGNVSEKKFPYQIYKTCSETNSTLDSGSCNVSCGNGLLIQTKTDTDKYNPSIICSKSSVNGGACNKGACSTPGTQNPQNIQVSQFTIYKWNYSTRKCSYTSNNPDKLIDRPYRRYSYYSYTCQCKVDVNNGSSYVGGATATLNTGHDDHATIYYRTTANGIKACKNEIPVNSWVYRVCTNEEVDNFPMTSNTSAKAGFHGYRWFGGDPFDLLGNGNIYRNFDGSNYWLHSGGSYDFRIKQEGYTPTQACEYYCKNAPRSILNSSD